jgi:predicted class III extradiol MEMO1 family dioxygenase
LFKRGIILIFLVFSCSRNEPSKTAETAHLYHTWISLKQREYGEPVHPAPEDVPPPGFFPWAGTVSHHLLAHDYIDAWFSRLAEMRQVDCFYLLCPSHFGLSTEPFSLTAGSWESGFGRVDSDIRKVRTLAKLLDVGMDPGVFEVEHGASTLMPYIKKYFPKALVVVIAYEGEAPVNVPKSDRLADALEKAFDKKGKRENFLLISTDFSHHGNLELTKKRDDHSLRFLSNPSAVSWYMVGCDNCPGIFVLDQLGRKKLESFIFFFFFSWEISNEL